MDDASADIPLRADPRPFGPPANVARRRAALMAAALALLALGAGGFYGWQQRSTPASAAALPTPSPAAAVVPAGAAATATEPVIQHPIDTPSATAPLPSNADAAMKLALIDLLGAKPVAAMLQSDGFARRVVATVDNLGRTHAAPLLWPVTPTAGRFTVQRSGEVEQIAAANASRYEPFVAFAASVDTARAASFYKTHYAQFQAAYRELGYPRAYFNDRVVEVIDQLLATPEPAGPVAVRLTEVKGPIASDRPWLRYEFVDPKLEALPAGSRMLVRMGNDNARRLKAQLQAFRAQIAKR